MTTTTTSSASAVRAGWNEFIVPAAAPYYKEPLVLVEGSGSTVTDAVDAVKVAVGVSDGVAVIVGESEGDGVKVGVRNGVAVATSFAA